MQATLDSHAAPDDSAHAQSYAAIWLASGSTFVAILLILLPDIATGWWAFLEFLICGGIAVTNPNPPLPTNSP